MSATDHFSIPYSPAELERALTHPPPAVTVKDTSPSSVAEACDQNTLWLQRITFSIRHHAMLRFAKLFERIDRILTAVRRHLGFRATQSSAIAVARDTIDIYQSAIQLLVTFMKRLNETEQSMAAFIKKIMDQVIASSQKEDTRGRSNKRPRSEDGDSNQSSSTSSVKRKKCTCSCTCQISSSRRERSPSRTLSPAPKISRFVDDMLKMEP